MAGFWVSVSTLFTHTLPLGYVQVLAFISNNPSSSCGFSPCCCLTPRGVFQPSGDSLAAEAGYAEPEKTQRQPGKKIQELCAAPASQNHKELLAPSPSAAVGPPAPFLPRTRLFARPLFLETKQLYKVYLYECSQLFPVHKLT